MEFLIFRTSGDDEKPCKGATAKAFVYVDRRTVKTLAMAKTKPWGDSFFSSGTNHREEYGMVARDLKLEKKWVIDIKSLEDLIKFCDKHGGLILQGNEDYKGVDYSIEIYDNYRE